MNLEEALIKIGELEERLRVAAINTELADARISQARLERDQAKIDGRTFSEKLYLAKQMREYLCAQSCDKDKEGGIMIPNHCGKCIPCKVKGIRKVW